MSRFVVQAVRVNGRTYDVCVILCGTNRVLLVVDNFEDVKAPGLLRQAAEEKAGCPGCIEDEEEGLHYSDYCPLEKKGTYVFYPSIPRRGGAAFRDPMSKSDGLCLQSPGRARPLSLNKLYWLLGVGATVEKFLERVARSIMNPADSTAKRMACPLLITSLGCDICGCSCPL